MSALKLDVASAFGDDEDEDWSFKVDESKSAKSGDALKPALQRCVMANMHNISA